MAVPEVQANAILHVLDKQAIPDATVMSRMNLTIDIGFTLWWGRRVMRVYEGIALTIGGFNQLTP
jgi:hypothetical protein